MMVDSEGQDILPKYQYHLKDHLGNVRLTFTSKPELYESNASIEPDLADGERADFINYDKVTKINSDLFNHTAGTDSHYSIRLSGTEGEKIGLAKSLAVMTGDTVRATVFGKYLDPEQTNYDQLVQNIVATVATAGATGTGTEAGTSTGGEGAFPFGGLLNKTGGDQGVMAYLNYLVFDKEGVLIEEKSGYEALTEAAKENGSDVPHEKLSKEIVVTESGFVYIYLSNDSPEPLEVIFDDFGVEQVHSAIVQADDYYPFGLTFNSYQRESSIANKYLYQGKEWEQDLGLNLYDFHARGYQPDLGRTWQLDPHSENYFDWSNYSWTGNNPLRNVDPTGMDWYSNNETRALEWIDVEEDEDGNKNFHRDGYTYVAGADASVGDISDAYNFINGDDAFGVNEFSTVASHKTGVAAESFIDAFKSIPDKIHQADLALLNFSHSVNSMELGANGRIGVKSAYIGVKAGFYSTGEETGGAFFSIYGNLDINSLSIQDFASFDYGGEGYLMLRTDGINSGGSALKGSFSAGYLNGTITSDGVRKLGIGFQKPGYSTNIGVMKTTEFFGGKTKEIQISQ